MDELVEIYAIGDSNEKGRALERQLGYVLGHLGYRDLYYKTHKTGEEIDVKGKIKLFDDPLIAECKAHKEPRPPEEIRKFFATFQTDLDKDSRTHGIFISLSGFTSNAKAWYDEKINEEKKHKFKLLNGKDFIDILNEEELLCSTDFLKSRAESITSMPITKKQLILTERGIFWKITTYADRSEISYVFFLESKGKLANKSDIQFILERDPLQEATLLQIKDRHNILKKLLDLIPRNATELSAQLNVPIDDIQVILDELFAENIIERNSEPVKLVEEYHAFYLIYKEAKGQGMNEVISFMLSKYYDKLIGIMIEPMIKRFFLNISNADKEVLIKILTISPKSLEYCLEGDSEHFKNSYDQMIKGKSVSKENLDTFNENQSRFFFQTILTKLFADCVETPALTSDLEAKENILTIFSRLEMKFGTQKEIWLKLYTEIPIVRMLLASGRGIKAGEYVSAYDINTYLDLGTRFFIVEEYERALKEYEEGIKFLQSTEKDLVTKSPYISIKINKAFTLKKLGRTEEALEQLKDIENSPILKDNEKAFTTYSTLLKELLETKKEGD